MRTLPCTPSTMRTTSGALPRGGMRSTTRTTPSGDFHVVSSTSVSWRYRRDDVQVVAVRLLRLVAVCAVVDGLCIAHFFQQAARFVLGEDVELAGDDVREPVAAEDHASSR